MRPSLLPALALLSMIAGCFPTPPAHDDTMEGDTAVTDTAQADSVVADTEQPDTVQPDTVQPDTVQPDTVQPDTVQPDTVPADTEQPCPGGCAHLDGVCVVGTCVLGSCEATPKSGPCDDGDACTQTDTCDGGVCKGADPVVCEAAGQCFEVGVCDSATGVCSTPKRPWDARCDSGTEYPGFCRDGECLPRMVAIGEAKTCLVVHGQLRCWTDVNKPARDQEVISFDHAVVEVAVSTYDDVCVRLSDDTVRCWGTDLGPSATPATSPPLPLGAASTIAAGNDSACIITRAEGLVRCWGPPGITGPGIVASVAYANADDVPPIPLARPVRSLCVGDSHACTVSDLGDIYCWGFGYGGALGYGSTANRGSILSDYTVPVALGGLDFQEVRCGGRWTCARTATGSVRCWGQLLSQGNGRVYGDDEAAASAGIVQFGGAVSYLGRPYPNSLHACAIVGGAGVRCWGAASGSAAHLGQEVPGPIGDNETPGSVPFVKIGTDVPVFVATGGYGNGDPGAATCVIGASGALYCWGEAVLLGYGDGSDRGGTPGSMPPGPVPFE